MYTQYTYMIAGIRQTVILHNINRLASITLKQAGQEYSKGTGDTVSKQLIRLLKFL